MEPAEVGIRSMSHDTGQGASTGLRPAEAAMLAALGRRSVVLVGMMGAGKSSIGRRLALRLGIPFVDADTEIEKAAGMTIPDIFAMRGEPEFRAGEARVIARLLDSGPQVLATGGGAFINAETRKAIASKGVSIWLNAEFDVLMRRIRRRHDRPLLKTADPAETVRKLIEERYPIYAQADSTVQSREVAARQDRRRDRERIDGAAAQRALLPGMVRHDRAASQLVTRSSSMSRSASAATRSPSAAGMLASLGQRIAALRPGARAAIVTDENVAPPSSASRASGTCDGRHRLDARHRGAPAKAPRASACSSRCARR